VDNPVDNDPIDVVICLGSSCFARGNAQNLRELKAYLEHHDIAANFRTRGRLCVKNCTSGPTIAINGVEYGNVQPGTAVALLERALQERKKEC
jgi:NADH:ubiquinone oxidoreductase subunit E